VSECDLEDRLRDAEASNVSPDVILAVANLHGTIRELRQLLETAVDAWECGQPVILPYGPGWKLASLPPAWYEAARKLVAETQT